MAQRQLEVAAAVVEMTSKKIKTHLKNGIVTAGAKANKKKKNGAVSRALAEPAVMVPPQPPPAVVVNEGDVAITMTSPPLPSKVKTTMTRIPMLLVRKSGGKTIPLPTVAALQQYPWWKICQDCKVY